MIEDFDEILLEVETALTRLNALYVLGACRHADKDAEQFDSAITQLLLSASILLSMRRKANQLVRDMTAQLSENIDKAVNDVQ